MTQELDRAEGLRLLAQHDSDDSWQNADELAKWMWANRRALLGDGWRGIETAPRDQLIDIWIRHGDGSGVRWTSCYYDQICDQWRTAPGGHLMWVPAKAVTHWQPLPPPPQTEQT